MNKPAPAKKRRSRSVGRILDSARRLFGRKGFSGATMGSVARAAGVSKGLLHYHFQSKEHLLIEATRVTFRQVNERFEDRFERGEQGLATALQALDAVFETVFSLRAVAPFFLEMITVATQDGPVREDLLNFYLENEAMLQAGIERVFEGQTEGLAVAPEQLAFLVRTGIHGILVELTIADGPEGVARVKQSYADLRVLFEHVLTPGGTPQ